MGELVKSINVWKLAIARLFIHCFIAGGTGYATTMSGLRWKDLDSDQKFMTLLGVSILVANIIAAFLDRTIERIAQGRSPIETGTTQFIQKDWTPPPS